MNEEQHPRLLMAFRADEVSVGDYLALPFGPAEVTATERTGMQIKLTARAGDEYVFAPMAHELVSLWEKR